MMDFEHPDGERLQKIMARMGVGSRRVNEDLIAAERVTVNGEIAILGARVHPETDEIAVDGAVLSALPDTITYLLNKPGGVITTADDPQGRPTVIEMVPDDPRVFAVGRLDLETEGLLLLTNNGDMAHRLTHPSFGIEKEYLAHVRGKPSRGALRQLREGIELDDGMTAPAQVAAVDDSLIRITIHEGRNRQVRRMFDAIGHQVLRLARTRIGPIADPQLAPGSWRILDRKELLALQRAIDPVETASRPSVPGAESTGPADGTDSAPEDPAPAAEDPAPAAEDAARAVERPVDESAGQADESGR